MNLKLVVASMSVLGLVSCPLLAATTTKHKHHHKHHHVVAQQEYKDMLPVPVCTISQNAMIMNSLDKNIGRAMPDPCNPGWWNRIQVSGGVNVDFIRWKQKH